MDWLSIVAGLFSSGKGSSGGAVAGGWFSTSTASDATGGNIVQNFGDVRPVYNQNFLSALEDIGPEKLAIAGFVVVAAFLIWRKAK